MTGVTYRNPALLTKQVTTLDTISGGRALLGIGAAWNEDEHRGYGYEFPPIRERMRIRVGESRVIYLVDDEAREVVVLRVARRSESTYRRVT